MEMFFTVIGFLTVVGLLLRLENETRKLERRIDALDSRIRQWEGEHERESDERNEKISSHAFELLDEEGKTRARLDTSAGMHPDDQPCLSFYDGNGVSRASLSLNNNSYPELYFSNFDENRSPSISNNGNNRCRILLGFDDEGYPRLLMYDDPKAGGYDPALSLAVQKAEWEGQGDTRYQSKTAGLVCDAWLGEKHEGKIFGARVVEPASSETA